MESVHARKMNTVQFEALKRMLKHRYKIDYDTYVEMYNRQKGRCGICKDPYPLGSKKGLLIDHDHATDVIRGLLCTNCNTGLGKFKESVTVLQNAIDYIT